jgi:hypothetical protein
LQRRADDRGSVFHPHPDSLIGRGPHGSAGVGTNRVCEPF